MATWKSVRRFVSLLTFGGAFSAACSDVGDNTAGSGNNGGGDATSSGGGSPRDDGSTSRTGGGEDAGHRMSETAAGPHRRMPQAGSGHASRGPASTVDAGSPRAP